MARRFKVTEQDGTEHSHDDINQAIAKAGNSATITDTKTGNEYIVRKKEHGDHAGTNL